MALIDGIQAITNKHFPRGKDVVSLLTQRRPLLKVMLTGKDPGDYIIKDSDLRSATKDFGGTAVAIPVAYQEPEGIDYGPGTVVPNAETDEFAQALFGLRGVIAGNKIGRQAQEMCRSEEAIIDLAKERGKILVNALARKMNARAWNTAASTAPTPNNFIGDIGNTSTGVAYGNITEAQIASWKANVTDYTSADDKVISEAKLQYWIDLINQNAECQPRYCFLPANLWNTIALLLNQKRQFVQNEQMAKEGFFAWEFLGVVGVKDFTAPAGYALTYTPEHLIFKALPGDDGQSALSPPKWHPMIETEGPGVMRALAYCRYVSVADHRAAFHVAKALSAAPAIN